MSAQEGFNEQDDLGSTPDGGYTRRAFIVGGGGIIAANTAYGRLLADRRPPRHASFGLPTLTPKQREALRVLGHHTLRAPDSLPDPTLPAGTDTLPEIEHVVFLMLENHSYDNFLGMLGRGPGQRPRGDGFRLARDGLPTATNPYADGTLQRAFRMPTTCQLASQPSQEWTTSHTSYDNGANDGFVRSTIVPWETATVGPVAMGYWTEDDLPLTYSLASTFPIADRWFCCLLGQTDPNRRFLIAGTSGGMTDDLGTGPPSGAAANALLFVPAANGTIFDRFNDAGISWLDYNESFPYGATMEEYPVNDGESPTNAPPISQFFTDAAAGTLPQFSFLDPNYNTQSQENPQNIVVGEAFLETVLDALRSSPLWPKTLFILTYDEHGGYFDHVPPPVALAPDSIAPVLNEGESPFDGFERYGFRVPALVVGPYAKRDYVSHVVYDHTSVLAFLERKWNLPAMTYRDANANDLTDFIDFRAIRTGRPTFPELPPLTAAGDTPGRLACSTTGPGAIPPPGTILPAPGVRQRHADHRHD